MYSTQELLESVQRTWLAILSFYITPFGSLKLPVQHYLIRRIVKGNLLSSQRDTLYGD